MSLSADRPPVAPEAAVVARDVEAALREDLGGGDLTADLLPDDARARASVVCREPAVIAGRPWFDRCFHALDPELQIHWRVREGEHVEAGALLCELTGRARPLVSGERCALNFLQALSGTATVTARHVDALRGMATRLLDTRKTLPGLRMAQKYAVRCGGGHNHRIGLFDAMLIKENHIVAAGGITAAVSSARRQHADALLEVEVESLDELAIALEAGVDRIMLDEFTPGMLRQAVDLNAGRVPLEVSGNVDLPQLAEIARLGVDFISVGALTKHVHAVDLSMRVQMD